MDEMPLVLVFGGQGTQLVCCEFGWYVPFLQGTQELRVPFKKVPVKRFVYNLEKFD